jgi:four helix bundle protein
LNYGEAQSAESKKDFIHKMGICLKELRETFVCLKIIEKANLSTDFNNMQKAKEEVNQLISIFVSSIKTSKNNT